MCLVKTFKHDLEQWVNNFRSRDGVILKLEAGIFYQRCQSVPKFFLVMPLVMHDLVLAPSSTTIHVVSNIRFLHRKTENLLLSFFFLFISFSF